MRCEEPSGWVLSDERALGLARMGSEEVDEDYIISYCVT